MRHLFSKDEHSEIDLTAMWRALQEEYFSDRGDLLQYDVAFSNRNQKRTLGSCNITKKRIRIARELNSTRYSNYTEGVLFHEMCHAVAGEDKSVRNKWHSPKFYTLLAQHPLSGELDKWIKAGGWRSTVRRSRSLQRWNRIKVAFKDLR